MALNWLYGGPPVRGDGHSFWIQRSHIVNLSDVLDIVAEMKNVCAEVHVVRGGNNALGDFGRSNDALDLDNPSDADLRAIFIAGYTYEVQLQRVRESGPMDVQPTIEVALGSSLNAACRVVLLDPLHYGPSLHGADARALATLSQRFERLLTSGRSRVPPWRWAQLGWLAAVLLLGAAWIDLVRRTWLNWGLATIALVAIVAFLWQARSRWTNWQQKREIYPRVGRVAIDPSPRERMRLERANARRDLKISVLSVLATVIGGIILYLLVGS